MTVRTLLPGAILGALMLAGCAAGPAMAPPSPASTPTASTASTPAPTMTRSAAPSMINLAGLDGCSFLDEPTVRGLAGWPADVRIASQRGSGPYEPSCFWGAAQGGVPGYVEIKVYRSAGVSTRQFGDACTVTAVTGIGTDAKGVTCPGTPKGGKVYLAAYERDVLVSLQVDQPSGPLAPSDLAPHVARVLRQVMSR